MWKIIVEELKYLSKTKWKIAALVLLLFVPAFYACSFLAAFNTPMKGMNNAKIAIVNLDKSSGSKNFTKLIAKTHQLKTVTDDKTFKMNITDATSIYKTEEEARQAVRDNKISGVFIVKPNFSKTLNDFFNNPNSALPIEKIEFYTSYKNNYLAAELLEMRASLNSLRKDFMIAAIKSYGAQPAAKFMSFLKLIDTMNLEKVFKSEVIGSDINDYGQGMFPYFFSIGLWAGCVMMVFMYKNHRPGKISQSKKTIVNYFSRTAIWVVTGWIQTLIMVSLAFAVGLRIQNVASLLFFTLFVSTLFSTIVQSIAFLFRMGELGSFFVLILLVTQLVAASATFPVEMQNSFFKGIHPILPFTYTVKGFREFLHHPTAANVLGVQWPIFIYLLLTPISLGYNIYVANNSFNKHGKFTSHEIDFHDE